MAREAATPCRGRAMTPGPGPYPSRAIVHLDSVSQPARLGGDGRRRILRLEAMVPGNLRALSAPGVRSIDLAAHDPRSWPGQQGYPREWRLPEGDRGRTAASPGPILMRRPPGPAFSRAGALGRGSPRPIRRPGPRFLPRGGDRLFVAPDDRGARSGHIRRKRFPDGRLTDPTTARRGEADLVRTLSPVAVRPPTWLPRPRPDRPGLNRGLVAGARLGLDRPGHLVERSGWEARRDRFPMLPGVYATRLPSCREPSPPGGSSGHEPGER